MQRLCVVFEAVGLLVHALTAKIGSAAGELDDHFEYASLAAHNKAQVWTSFMYCDVVATI
jgi:hypothetical protein